MTPNFPTSLDDNTSLHLVVDASTDVLDEHHNDIKDAVIAAETKIGTGASTPTAGKLLVGDGAGASGWRVLTNSDLPTESSPVGLKISTASKGGVFNGGFEIDDTKTDSGATSSYETTIVYKGSRSLKIAYTTTAADYVDLTDKFLIGNGKTYKVTFMGYASVAKSIKLNANGASQTLGTFTIAAGSWSPYQATFTASGDYTLARFLGNDTTASSVYIDELFLEEVVVDTTFTGKVAEKTRPVSQAVTSTDNIDQSLDSGGAYTNTYALTSAINEGATHIQTFTPTKKYTTQIGIWVVAKGTTADWCMVVHDAANKQLANTYITNANLTNGAFNYFNVPNIWASGALHFHIFQNSATGTPTCKANTSDDLETASFIQRCGEKTEGMKVVGNGIPTELKADKDGILTGSIVDLDNGKYLYDSGTFTVAPNFLLPVANDIFSITAGGRLLAFANISLINDWQVNAATLVSKNDAVTRTIVFKVNTLLPIKHLKISAGYNVLSGAGPVTMGVSADNINYTTLRSRTDSSNGTIALTTDETDLMNRLTSFYIKFNKDSASSDYMQFSRLMIWADLDTSKIPTGLFYPLAVNQFAETVKLPSTADRIYFQSAKYTNEYGVVVPALEFCSTTVPVGYIPLKIDNSQETSPCVSILSTTTNYQQSGTGSNVTGGVVLNTGEYVTLTSAVSELKVDYQVGTGTTAIAAITKNILHLSSNGEGNDSTQDPSHQANFIVGVRQQGITDSLKDTKEETASVKQGIANTQQMVRNNSLIVGFDNGATDDYAITLPNFTGYTTGMSVLFKANTVNTGACTLNINGMGAKAIVKGITTALSNADILALMWCQCVYDGVAFVLLNPRAL